MENRFGAYIETYTGISFFPLDPRENEIVDIDIAHSLSQICRYGGHCKFFYSVAQHSINVYKYLKNKGCSLEILFDAFLHDVAEAYLIDLPRPIKTFIPDYKKYELKLQEIIYKKYGLLIMNSEEVKNADNVLLSHEANILMPCKTWNHNPIIIDGIKIEERKISDVKEEFLTIFLELQNKVKRGV